MLQPPVFWDLKSLREWLYTTANTVINSFAALFCFPSMLKPCVWNNHVVAFYICYMACQTKTMIPSAFLEGDQEMIEPATFFALFSQLLRAVEGFASVAVQTPAVFSLGLFYHLGMRGWICQGAQQGCLHECEVFAGQAKSNSPVIP